MGLNGFNLTNYQKFDNALSMINSLSDCNISSVMSKLDNNNFSKDKYSDIFDLIGDIQKSITLLANGEGPEKLIDNYKTGYDNIKNAIIEAYVAEYEFALENGNIDVNTLKNLSANDGETFKNEFKNLLQGISSNNFSNYASLADFFTAVQSIFSKYSMTFNDDFNISNLQPKNNRDIAHRGYTPGGIYDNSIEGFRMAGEKGFWGCETDIRFDKNGNLVCSHNEVQNGENPPTFEEYLDICKEYGMTAIIDLKYANGPNTADLNLSASIIDVIKSKGMMDSCILQTNNPIDIPYIRENSKYARIWYLTDVISDDNINLIEENKVECVNILSGENNAYRIKKLNENGIDVCVWNVQSELSKNNIINMGAKYIMSDEVLGITPYQEGQTNLNDLRFNLEENIIPILLGTDGKENNEPIPLGTDGKENNEPVPLGTNGKENNEPVPLGTNGKENPNNGTLVELSANSTSQVRLTATMGFNPNGPSGTETWYDLNMNQVVKNMEELYGYKDLESSIRSDGVKILSGTAPDGTKFTNLVMVAADVNHMQNPTGTFERGQIVETSLGTGIVVDYCERSVNERKATGNVHFDLATAWWTEPYASQAYSKNNNTPLSNNINNLGNNNPSTLSNPSGSGNPSTLSNPSGSGNPGTPSSPSGSGNPSIPSSPSGSGNPSIPSSPSSSGNPSIPSSPSSSGNPSIPSSPSDSTLGSGVTLVNTLPKNKFSDVLPQVFGGNLGSMEINGNSINYEIYNVSNLQYENYVQSLLDGGYVMTNSGTFIKGDYEVIINLTQDGNMNINCRYLTKV